MTLDRETELLLRLRRRDEAALAELYGLLSRPVLALALRLLDHRQEAEEVLQDTFVRVFDRAQQFNPDLGSARAFIYTVARHEAISRLRARQARPRPTDDPDDDFARLDGAADDPDARATVGSAVARLPERDRVLVREAFFLGFSHGEIADRQALPLGTVKTRLRRALLAMRRNLEGL